MGKNKYIEEEEDIDFAKLDFGKRNPHKNKNIISWNIGKLEQCCENHIDTFRGSDGKFHCWAVTVCPVCSRAFGISPDKQWM